MSTSKAAVLLITFNRPDTTKVVLEAIAKYEPERLYVFSDGPREHNFDEDSKNIAITRALFEKLNWGGELITRFMEQNQGCGLGVSGAINWAFETEEQLIILEDDCVPSMSFFNFCNNLLHKYQNDSRVMHITGTRWNDEFNVDEESYFFSKYAHIWGWATWKRAWEKYDFLMEDWNDFRRSKILNHVLDNYFPLVKRWDFMFNSIYELKRKHTWDYQWQYAVFKNNGLCATPVQNLVTNIGDVGVHFSETTKAHHRNRGELNENLVHPRYFHPHYRFDKYHGKSFFLEGRSVFRLTYDQTIGRIKYVYQNNQSS
ncbi:glycosyltransferase family 2 protein [Pedobacter endophyticus]|uniref:Glycosyltransferase family 2 protein n=1 Tax=Pedobacter endophyticus TaxID=2789740 RepID=A0A7S9L0C3_9SPHI|nr:glycosyltransferase family 2 protein [Pedobacter endophyticus]QPH39934.1 glycosyltransferase family 2 protein [Pedobacter endophyticus]